MGKQAINAITTHNGKQPDETPTYYHKPQIHLCLSIRESFEAYLENAGRFRDKLTDQTHRGTTGEEGAQNHDYTTPKLSRIHKSTTVSINSRRLDSAGHRRTSTPATICLSSQRRRTSPPPTTAHTTAHIAHGFNLTNATASLLSGGRPRKGVGFEFAGIVGGGYGSRQENRGEKENDMLMQTH